MLAVAMLAVSFVSPGSVLDASSEPSEVMEAEAENTEGREDLREFPSDDAHVPDSVVLDPVTTLRLAARAPSVGDPLAADPLRVFRPPDA